MTNVGHRQEPTAPPGVSDAGAGDCGLSLCVRVLRSRPEDSLRAGRTLRSLTAAGFRPADLRTCGPGDLPALVGQGGPLLVLAAGAWLADTSAWSVPPMSATGRGICALGAVRTPPAAGKTAAPAAAAWARLVSETGGDLNRLAELGADFDFEPQALFLDADGVRALDSKGVLSLRDLFLAALPRLRVVHFGPLDVYTDSSLRVMQAITSLQRGGAERMTLDLMAELPALGVTARLATLGRPSRAAFAAPPGTLELAQFAPGFGARVSLLAEQCVAAGIDLVHAHLVSGDVVRHLSLAGLPVIVTVHNTSEAWPAGLAELHAPDAVLLAACSRAVAAELRAANTVVPIRTAPNGFDLRQFRLTPERLAGRASWRRRWGFAEADFILAAVANPRPQKRLERLPAILAGLRARLGPEREARLVLCGEPMRGNAPAAESVARLQSEIARLALAPHVCWAGAVADVADVLAAVDVLVSTSAHEGLSLACLEALALGRPVVATDVGGARDVAADAPALRLLPPEAGAGDFVEALLPLLNGAPAAPPDRFLANWSNQRMASRYQCLYRRALASTSAPTPGCGLWLVANNFSTGGAQSSARRLLLGLAGQGIPVRAGVIEEYPDYPTPGRQALLQAGVPVISVGPPDDIGRIVDRLIEAIGADPPQSVLFWNLRPAVKVALADALLHVPVFDVSPGEMCFDSLSRHFARSEGAWPYRTARDYGACLAGVIVKYQAEAALAAEVLGAPVHVIPNGVPECGAGILPAVPAEGGAGILPAAPVQSGAGILPAPAIIFGTAARINPQKRLEDLLAAFRLAYPRLPACALRIAGRAEAGCEDYVARLRAMAAGLPVEWLGEVRDMAAFHRGLDVFVMISDPAGCPNASLEAMADGLPLIATDVGGASEQAINRQTGCLVPTRDPAALAAAMVALAADPAARRTLGEGARALIQERFRLERMVADYRRVCVPESRGDPDSQRTTRE